MSNPNLVLKRDFPPSMSERFTDSRRLPEHPFVQCRRDGTPSLKAPLAHFQARRSGRKPSCAFAPDRVPPGARLWL